MLENTDWERERLDTLRALRILDTRHEREFDDIAQLAALVTSAPSAGISLVDDTRQWFKAQVGIDLPDIARADSFCEHAVASRTVFEIGDASVDHRFADNPFVVMEDGIRFYAGAPLLTEGGRCLGTLCVFDKAVRAPLSHVQRTTLEYLAGIVVERMESRATRLDAQIAARVIDTTSDAVLAIGADGVIISWNRAAEGMFGHPASVAIGATLDLILPSGPSAEAHHRGFARSLEGGHPTLIGKTVELSARRSSGAEFPIELSLARWTATPEDNNGGCAAIIRDISPRKALERDRDDARLFLDSVIQNLPAMLFVKDSETRRYLLLNKAGEDVLGRAADTVVGYTDKELFDDGSEYHDLETRVLASLDTATYESEFERNDGRVVTLSTKRIVIDQPGSGRKYILGLTDDVTDLRRSQANVMRLAQHDSLTGLFNRSAYLDRLASLVATQRRFAILMIDLDRFKAINDQFGHLTGDLLLIEVGNRLRRIAGPDDMVARIGGDEFVIVIAEQQPGGRAIGTAKATLSALCEPYLLGRFAAHARPSLGIVLAPEDGESVEDLRKAADLALHSAKSDGRGSIRFFNADMNRAATDRRLIEHDLRLAIENREIYVEYQPVIATATGKVSSFEALARWQHPTRGAIGPDVFIAIAEESGLVAKLGEHVLQVACSTAVGWPAHIRIAVNLSPLQFESHDLVRTISGVLAQSGLAANRLQLEVTEGLVIRDVDNSFRVLAELRTLGVQILMDDFGVGYSSLSYFERFPFDKVKIDRSFVRKMSTVPAARAIIEAIVGLGRALGMGIVAEGVENAAQRDALTAIGCTHLQGYFFSAPRPAEAFETTGTLPLHRIGSAEPNAVSD